MLQTDLVSLLIETMSVLCGRNGAVAQQGAMVQVAQQGAMVQVAQQGAMVQVAQQSARAQRVQIWQPVKISNSAELNRNFL